MYRPGKPVQCGVSAVVLRGDRYCGASKADLQLVLHKVQVFGQDMGADGCNFGGSDSHSTVLDLLFSPVSELFLAQQPVYGANFDRGHHWRHGDVARVLYTLY